nr:unnamed protein product [Digitaria exilis]
MFPIVGFGGVGKTTLAMEVCKLLEDVFPYQAMVSVSQAFDPTKDIKALLDRVLQQIVKPKKEIDKGIKEEGTTLQGSDVVDKLKNFLDGKRRAWEAIRAKLPADNKHDCQGRIIITTRIEAVATACCPNRDCILRVKPLNTADSNKLLLTKVFGSEDASYPSQLEAVMGSILKRCGGLPLAIVSIASVLAGHKSAESIGKWVRVNNSIGSLMESNPTLEGMRHIITLSYNHLPYELKSCIMYLSMFPEDYEIDTDRLLCRWIAEGLVPEKRGLTLMEVAESYLEDLVSRNMIQRYAGWHYDELCRVHDMLLEVMVSKSLESNFVSLLGGPYAGISYDRIRRLSIHGAVARTNKKAAGGRHGSRRHGSFQEMDVKHVRSLSTFVEAEPEAGHHSLQLLDQLGKFTLLRVLDLENCKEVTDKHMSSICRLYLLKFLNLKGTGITLVPPQVGKLEHLQSFDVRDTRVQELPQTMTNLEKLERIMSPEKAGWEPVWRLPQGLSNMKALRQVAGSFLGNDVQVAQELGELQQLQKLLIYMRRADSSDELLDMLAESLCKLSTLQALNIAEIGNEHGNLLNFLHRLQQPPRLLRYMRMFGGMEGSPPWVDSLVNLTVFEIANGVSIDTDRLFDALGSRHIFPALRNFSMSLPYNTELREIQFQEGSMANLKTLIVRLGPNEVGMVGSKHLKNLKEVHITGPRNSRPFNCAIEELKAESASRPESSRFEVSVSYW